MKEREFVVSLEYGDGRVGLARCPGLDRPADLGADVAKLRAWGATAVITGLSEREVSHLGLGELGDAIESLGMDWHHVPIADFGVPDFKAEARWRHASLRLRRDLSRGGAAVFHCRGRLGRTGTLAARFLIDMGENPESAVARVRRARPGAVETEEQLAHVLAQEPLARLPDEPSFEERIFGCLLGGAVGDGFGYAIEFERLPAIRRRFGKAGLCEPILDNGRLLVSDDTQMTMFTAEGLIRAHERMCDRGIVSIEGVVWRAYKRWVRTQGFDPPQGEFEGQPGWLIGEASLHARRAPGNTCLSALRASSAQDGDPAKNSSKGCGGVMRVAPVGLLPLFFDSERAFELGAKLAALTHGHATGYLAAGALAAMIRMLMPVAVDSDEEWWLIGGSARASVKKSSCPGSVSVFQSTKFCSLS